ncbi:YdcF family protein [Halalkalibacter sp. APA_J-10(15)]|uniref:YdcF family protein n=1 Tax=Halalkalibacter sp. APA_J-10(15) TaxID=2933805 RepID=UPI001FF572C1|nr:YdcF family protein [Halalkalibacter sp. APA_J-10(15)]MCK0473184.1 YdcF family protein [Halalkalibacter sp. APA_J-10(15)]
MKKKIIAKIVVVFASLIVICIAICAYSIWSYSEVNQLVKADAAIVLGAAAWEDEPSPVLRERINHAIWLYDNEYVDKIIFTGGKGDNSKYAESEVARDYAIEHHIPPGDILIEIESSITEENLRYASEVAFENHLHSFIIVSDPLHMKRAMLMAENTGLEAYSSPTPSSMYQSLNSKIPFWIREVFFYIGYLISWPFRTLVAM